MKKLKTARRTRHDLELTQRTKLSRWRYSDHCKADAGATSRYA